MKRYLVLTKTKLFEGDFRMTPRANSCMQHHHYGTRQLVHNGGLMAENDSYLKKGFGFLWGIKWLQTFTDQLWSPSPQDANRQQHSGGSKRQLGGSNGWAAIQCYSLETERQYISTTQIGIVHTLKVSKCYLLSSAQTNLTWGFQMSYFSSS